MRSVRRSSSSLLALVALVAGLIGSSPARAAETKTLSGTIDGADYKIEVPGNWNGTVLLFSHGAVAPGAPNPALNAPSGTSVWLLDHGYALAGSSFARAGWALAEAQRDNIALLDYFASAVGTPKRTIAWGNSQGGLIAAQLVQKAPDRFDAAMPYCGVIAGGAASWNIRFDSAFVAQTLLDGGSDLKINNIQDPAADARRNHEVLTQAQDTPAGRARLALAATVGDVPSWFNPVSPAPGADDYLVREANQFGWIDTNILGSGLSIRMDLERRAGGNYSWNTGVNYRQQLERSVDRDQVYALYGLAGLDLEDDLRTLDSAPRIQAEPRTMTYLNEFVQIDGRLQLPVLTLHTTGDGAARVQEETAYANAVRSAGKGQLLRQIFVNRAGHCTFTPAELITALQVLIQRLDTGRWEGEDAVTLNAQAARLGPELNMLITGVPQPVAMQSAFVEFQPAPFLRPWDARCGNGGPVDPLIGQLGPICL